MNRKSADRLLTIGATLTNSSRESFEAWRDVFLSVVQESATAAPLKAASLAEDLKAWTACLTTAVVRSCEQMGWQAAGKGHELANFPKAGQEYLGIDVMAFEPQKGSARWPLPIAVFELEMDVLLNYISSGRKLGMRDQFFNFLQNLCEEARARNNLVLCVSIPRSDLEMNPDDQRDHDSNKKLCDRVGKAILMSADKEMSEIIRRRLFEWDGLNAEPRPSGSGSSDVGSDGLDCERFWNERPDVQVRAVVRCF